MIASHPLPCTPSPAIAEFFALAVWEYEIECPFLLDQMNPALLDVYLAAFCWVFSSRAPPEVFQVSRVLHC